MGIVEQEGKKTATLASYDKCRSLICIHYGLRKTKLNMKLL
jgi:hypothetical protein